MRGSTEKTVNNYSNFVGSMFYLLSYPPTHGKNRLNYSVNHFTNNTLNMKNYTKHKDLSKKKCQEAYASVSY